MSKNKLRKIFSKTHQKLKSKPEICESEELEKPKALAAVKESKIFSQWEIVNHLAESMPDQGGSMFQPNSSISLLGQINSIFQFDKNARFVFDDWYTFIYCGNCNAPLAGEVPLDKDIVCPKCHQIAAAYIVKHRNINLLIWGRNHLRRPIAKQTLRKGVYELIKLS